MRSPDEVRHLMDDARRVWEATSDQKSFTVFSTLLWVLGADIVPSLPQERADEPSQDRHGAPAAAEIADEGRRCGWLQDELSEAAADVERWSAGMREEGHCDD